MFTEIDDPTKLNVSFVLLPRVVMAAMHTTTIRASMTAYSTAVGPSSLRRKFTHLVITRRARFLTTSPPHGTGKMDRLVAQCRLG